MFVVPFVECFFATRNEITSSGYVRHAGNSLRLSQIRSRDAPARLGDEFDARFSRPNTWLMNPTLVFFALALG
jgi:hypothetical protein